MNAMSTIQSENTDRGFSITAVERKIAQKHIDIFVCGDDGIVYTAWWDEGHRWSTATREPHWRQWRNLGSRNFPPKAPVAAVSRSPEKLDIFVCSSDHRVYTKSWSYHQGWSDGWFDLGGAGENGDLFAPGTEITALSRDSDTMDIFGSATTGDVYKSYWCGDKCCMGWSSVAQRLGARWKNLGGRRYRKSAAANVAAVARDDMSMDVFFSDDEGHVLHKTWHGESPAHWDETWQDVGGQRLSPGGHISAVSRKPTQIDIYACGVDGCVYTSWWTKGWGWSGINDGSWHFLGGDDFPPGAPITAVAVNEDHLDIGLLDKRGSMHRKWWNKKGRHWHSWNDLGGSAAPGSTPATISVSPTRIDTFIVRNNGEVFNMMIGVSGNATRGNHWASIGTLPPPVPPHATSPQLPKTSNEGFNGFANLPLRPSNTTASPEGMLASSDNLGTLQYRRDSTDKWFERFAALLIKHKIQYNPKKVIKVAILDSGINIDGCWRFDEYEKARVRGTKSFIDDQPEVDNTGHGSRIAAIILRLTMNVDLYIAKVTNTTAVGEQEATKALNCAREIWKVDIISISFGLPNPHQGVYNELDKCVKAGITIFAAASNAGGEDQVSWPARSERVLCIYASTWQGRGFDGNPSPESFKTGSRKGVDKFSAVGMEIRPIWFVDVPNALEIEYESGTSFATPVAVSIAAFMIAYIEKKWPDYNWIVKPSSTEGIISLLRLVSTPYDGYDWLCPTRYLSTNKEDEVFVDLKRSLDAR